MFTRPGNWPPGGSTLNCSGDVAPPLGTRGLAALWFITHDGSIVLLYIVTWIPSIYPSHVSTYTSTMDPMGYKRVINHQLCIPGQYLYIYIIVYLCYFFFPPLVGFVRFFKDFIQLQHILVGGFNLPLWKIWVRRLGVGMMTFPYMKWKVIQKSMVPVTTNQPLIFHYQRINHH